LSWGVEGRRPALGAAQLALCALGIALYALSMAEIVLADPPQAVGAADARRA